MNMLIYILKRLGLAVIAILVLATITFLLTRAAPGDPFTITKEIPAETKKRLEEKYGMDKPLYVQFFMSMEKMIFHLDFGESFRTKGRDVNEIIRDQFPVSAKLGFISTLIGFLIGIVFGIIAAVKKNTKIDRGVMFLIVIGISLPSFLFAYIFQYTFAIWPMQGIIGTFLKNNNIITLTDSNWLRPAGWGNLRDYILPSLSLALINVAFLARLMRQQMIEIQFSDFIKTAKSKGVGSFRLIFLHQLRNAVLPVFTIIGPLFVSNMMGAIVIEPIYGIPGLGLKFIQAITNNDYNVIFGLVVFEGAFSILIILITDLLYGVIDPRIRISK